MPRNMILAVEDDDLFSEYLKEALERLGYGVLQPVRTGKDAIAQARAQEPDLILMDVGLEGEMDGIAAARAIQSFSDIPIIYLTGFTDDPLLEAAKATVPYGYLVKPVSKEGLGAAIETALYRHGVEAELKSSESRLRLALASAHMGVLEWEARTRKIFWSHECAEIVGVEELGSTFDQYAAFFHPDDASEVMEVLGRVSKEGPEFHVEFRIVRPDGGIRWLTSSGQGYFTESGALTRIVATLQDITDRKKADGALRSSEQRFRSLFETSKDTILLVDQKDGRIVTANAAACKLYGYSRKELLSLKATDISAEPGKTAKGVRRSVPKAPVRLHRKKDGTLFPVEVSGGSFVEGDVHLHTAFIRDITERQTAEEQLMIANLAMRSGISATGMADLDGRVTYVNDSFLRLWGYESADEVIGRNMSEFAMLGNDSEGIRTLRKGNNYIGEGLAKRKDGSAFYVHQVANVVKTGDGKPLCIMTSLLDISERRETEEALRESEERYRVAIESSNDGVTVVRGQTRLFVNQRFLDMFGYESEEIIGEAFYKTVHPDDREKAAEYILKVQKGEPVPNRYEYRGITKTGDIKYIEASVAQVTYQGEPVGLAYLRDITERREAEESLRTSRLQLVEAAEMAKIAYWEFDETADEFIFNDVFYDLYGTTAEHEGGYRMTAHEYRERFIHPDDLEEVMRRVTEFGDGRPRANALQHHEHRNVRADGQIITILTQSRAVLDSEGRTIKIVGVNQDITARKKTEEALQKSEAKFRSYIELSPLAIFVANREGRIVEVNRATVDLLGYGAETLLAMHVWDVHPEEDRGDILDQLASFPAEGHLEAERRFQKQDGSIVWLSVHAAHIGDGLTLAYCSDITGRKQAEETLKRYELLSEHSRDMILFTGLKGDIVEANAAACEAHGYCRNEILGLTTKDLRADGAIGMTNDQLVEKESWITLFETVHRRKDGSTFPVEVSVSPDRLTIDGKETVISIVRDITNRKERDQEIEMLKHSIDVHSDGAYWMDSTNRFVYVNEAACRMLGYEREDLVGKTIYDVSPGATPEGMNEIWKGLRRDGSFLMESMARRKDGRDFPVEIVTAYVQFGGREFACGFAHDITEKKRLGEQLRQAQKMEAIGTLAGGVAHDFNNILTVIMGLGNVIQMSLGPDDRLKPLIDQIVHSSEKAADLTQSLLAFSRKQKITASPHQVNGVVASAAKLLKRLLSEDIVLKVNLGDDHTVAMLDVGQVDQVLMNLATNARDAMPHGGMLTIRTEATELDEAFSKIHGFGRPGKYVRLSVSDTGFGMDKKTMERIFDPFFTTKEIGKGTGLGLASVYGIVKQHGGYITVKSALLKGTTFDVYLPLLDAPVRATAGSIKMAGGSETILVLEDDTDVRNMLTKILTSEGYATLEADNGDDAIEVFNEHRKEIGLVILDVVMPGKNGREVLDEIARVEPGIKAIFMSGYAGDVVLDKGVKKESVDFLQKPLSVKDLLTKVREVLDRQPARSPA